MIFHVPILKFLGNIVSRLQCTVYKWELCKSSKLWPTYKSNTQHKLFTLHVLRISAEKKKYILFLIGKILVHIAYYKSLEISEGDKVYVQNSSLNSSEKQLPPAHKLLWVGCHPHAKIYQRCWTLSLLSVLYGIKKNKHLFATYAPWIWIAFGPPLY